MIDGKRELSAGVRYYAIDYLRAAMISCVMFGHALLPYVTVPRSFKDSQTSIGFDAAAIFIYSFAMPAFFVTAGFAAALLYAKRGLRGLVRNRVQAILLPLLISYPLLSPLTRGAYAFAKEAAATGSIDAGIDVLLLGDWLRWSKAYHLWFLVSLLLYTALAVLLRRGLLQVCGRRIDIVRTGARRLIASRWRGLLLSLLAMIGMLPAYVFYDGDATTPPMQAALFGFFVFGWLLYANRDLLPELRRGSWQLIAVAVALLPLATWGTRIRLIAVDELQLTAGVVAGATNAALAALMTLGLLGVFQQRFDKRPSVLGQYVSEASYWIFLIHFPLLIAVAGLFSVTPFAAIVKYLLTLLVVVPLVIATYHFGVRATPLGRMLKGRKPAAKP